MLAITILLTGNALGEAQKIQQTFSERCQTAFCENNSVPHITLIAGIKDTRLGSLKVILEAKANVFEPVTLRTKGIGLLALQSPLVYLRWSENAKLNESRLALKKCLIESKIIEKGSEYNDDWILKSTVCYRDTTYSLDLIKAVEQCSLAHTESTMRTESLCITRYEEGTQEENIFHIRY